MDNPSQLARKGELPLLGYTVDFGFHHFQEAERHGASRAELIDQHFGADDEAFENYASLYNSIHQGDKYSQGYSLFQLAVECNLVQYVEMRLARNATDINVLLEAGQNYVQLAVWKKHKETLKVLLSHGADVNLPVSYSHSQSSLYMASYRAPYTCLPPPGDCMPARQHRNGRHAIGARRRRLGLYRQLRQHAYKPSLALGGVLGEIQVVQRLLDADPATFSHPEIRLSAIVGLSDLITDFMLEGIASPPAWHQPEPRGQLPNDAADLSARLLRA